MGDNEKSPMDLMLEAAYQAELKILEERERRQAEKPKKKPGLIFTA
jgi:hypothetical protein